MAPEFRVPPFAKETATIFREGKYPVFEAFMA